MKSRSSRRGFTLVELLVVMAIIALMTGALGFGLRGASAPQRLAAGQQTLLVVLEKARQHAISREARAALVVAADPQNDGFLRQICVAIETAPGSNRWRLEGEGVTLPAEIFVVPGESETRGVDYRLASGAWPAALHSTIQLAQSEMIVTVGGGQGGTWFIATTTFDARGRPADEGEISWVVAAGRRLASGVVFENPLAAKGAQLSRYGVGLAVERATDFEN